MTSAAAWAPAWRQRSSGRAAAPGGEEPRGEQVARAGRVDDLVDRRGGDLDSAAAFDRQRARGSPGHDQGRDERRKPVQSAVEVGRTGKKHCLVLIGEEDVDHPALDHPEHAFLAAGDAEAFRQSEGDGSTGLVRDLGGAQHRLAWPLGSPQIAFEEGDRGGADQLLVEALRRQLVAGARAGVHRPLRVGRDQDQAAPGRRAFLERRRFEPHAERVHVVRENLAELVVGDLADEAGIEPSAATPAMLLAAEPPLISRAGPIAA